VYWPPDLPRDETLDNFVSAFQALGYSRCSDGILDVRYEKIALYVDSHGTPTHAARQLEGGAWTSKLGGDADIEHSSPGGLEDSDYGAVAAYLQRERA